MTIQAPDISRKRKTKPPPKPKPLPWPVLLYYVDDEEFEMAGVATKKFTEAQIKRKNGFVHQPRVWGMKVGRPRIYIRAGKGRVLDHETMHITGQIKHD